MIYVAEEPGLYSVLVTNPCGSVRDSIYISYKDCETYVMVPNAFTPNNDGNNDEFGAKGANLGSFRMYIYNRWGEQVFQSHDLNQGWDGRYAGLPCPNGIYVWIIRYTGISDADAGEQVKKGNVLLLR
jgi:gliding motility-associated-like protein